MTKEIMGDNWSVNLLLKQEPIPFLTLDTISIIQGKYKMQSLVGQNSQGHLSSLVLGLKFNFSVKSVFQMKSRSSKASLKI